MPEWIVEAETIGDLVEGCYTIVKKFIRCRDCVYWDNSNKYPVCYFYDDNKENDDFCSYGKRRSE